MIRVLLLIFIFFLHSQPAIAQEQPLDEFLRIIGIQYQKLDSYRISGANIVILGQTVKIAQDSHALKPLCMKCISIVYNQAARYFPEFYQQHFLLNQTPMILRENPSLNIIFVDYITLQNLRALFRPDITAISGIYFQEYNLVAITPLTTRTTLTHELFHYFVDIYKLLPGETEFVTHWLTDDFIQFIKDREFEYLENKAADF